MTLVFKRVGQGDAARFQVDGQERKEVIAALGEGRAGIAPGNAGHQQMQWKDRVIGQIGGQVPGQMHQRR